MWDVTVGEWDFVAARPSIDEMLNVTWWKRAWTFQEFYLAKRAILVFQNELVFVCQNGCWREGRFQVQPLGNYNDSSSLERLHQLRSAPVYAHGDWHNYRFTVENYTSRRLSHEDDRIPAFQGWIADRYAGDLTALRSGILLPLMGPALGWKTFASPPVERALHSSQPSCSTVPSWSWASCGKPVVYPMMMLGTHSDEAPLLFHHTDEADTICAVPNNMFWQSDLANRLVPDHLTNDQSWRLAVQSLQRSRKFTKRVPVLRIVTIMFNAIIGPILQHKRDSKQQQRVSLFPLDPDTELPAVRFHEMHRKGLIEETKYIELSPDAGYPQYHRDRFEDSNPNLHVDTFLLLWAGDRKPRNDTMTVICVSISSCGSGWRRTGVVVVGEPTIPRAETLHALLGCNGSNAKWAYIELL